MRILVSSDIHLECGPFLLPEDIGEADGTVFAGAIDRPNETAIA